MLPPPLIRRLVLAPLVIAIAACLIVLTPAVALLSAAFTMVRRRTQPDRVRRGGGLGGAARALAGWVGEPAALPVMRGWGIGSGFGGRLPPEPYQARHYEI